MTAGKSVKLFLVDGLCTAEIMNWTGHIMAAQRSDLGELLRREEAGRTGVYILFGDDLAYIGEGDVIRKRLAMHNRPEGLKTVTIWSSDRIRSSPAQVRPLR